ncbi:MAG TPA: extracellular solute-binding protein [Stellaceae bacterium]|nr:extracellular solute-binding protein [Stellaceae bacterium]
MQTLSRRSLIVSAAALPLLRPTSVLAQGQSITILIWGTTWQLVMKGIAEKFTAATGIAVNLMTQTTGGESLVKLQAMKADPTVDVWFTTSSVAERAVKDGDLFADLPTAQIPNLKNVYPDAIKPRWVGAYAYPLGIVYRPDLVKQPITSWEDLWSSRFVNQIGVPAPSSYQGRMLLLASVLAGGGIDNVEPGFEKLKALSKNVAFWYTSDAQARKALAQGEISVLIAPPSGAKTVRNQGVEVTMISPKPAPVLYDVMTLVKTKRQELGARFIDFVLSTESQAQIATDMENEPVNRFASIPDRLKGQFPKDGDTVAFDEDVVNARIDAWSDRFKQVVAQ